jgi:NDP-sugar pyrophosphorylase family protein
MTETADLPPLALLAGGMATRLRPLTATMPKAMIKIVGEPFIAHQLRLVRSRGIGRVVICAGYLAEQVRDFVGNGARFDLKVDYSVDYPRLLGTGGALRKALPLLDRQFLVMYGDSYLPVSIREVVAAYRRAGKPGLMAVYRNDGKWDTSNVEFADGEILRYDKHRRTREMRYIDYGLGVLDASVLERWPADEPFDLVNVYRDLVRRKELAGWEAGERFYEIGSHEGLKELSGLLAERDRR